MKTKLELTKTSSLQNNNTNNKTAAFRERFKKLKLGRLRLNKNSQKDITTIREDGDENTTYNNSSSSCSTSNIKLEPDHLSSNETKHFIDDNTLSAHTVSYENTDENAKKCQNSRNQSFNNEKNPTGATLASTTVVVVDNDDPANNECLPKVRTSLQRCFDLTRHSRTEVVVDSEKGRSPSPVLPMVKFDSNGDFEKEHFQPPIDETELNNKNGKEGAVHLIRLNKYITIDTKKFKRYLKVSLKFAFSQIGLVGLVVGYVILGAIIIMKIESSYERENQQKIERNREDFFENVRHSAENLFNDYLNKNFHMKYNQFRNEEMRIKENQMLRKNSRLKSRQKSFRNNPMNLQNHTNNKINLVNEYDYEVDLKKTSKNPHENTNTAYSTADIQQSTIGKYTSTPRSPPKTKRVKYDRKSFAERQKTSWYVELDRDQFTRQIKSHLGIMYIENEAMEDKDQQGLMVRENVWDLPNALLYSATVITTIGYGNITPKSNFGKIFTIFYAMIGIPLMFMCLTNTGDLLADIFISSYTKCIRYCSKKLCQNKLKMPYSASKFHENKEHMMNEFEMEYDNPNDKHVPIVATIGVLTFYILAGAVIFSITEGWNVLDGAYFCFITFTTIGFGDFVPGKNTLDEEKGGVAFLCTLYLLLGMVITAMCIKLMQDEVVAKAKLFGQRVGIIDAD